MYCIGIDEVGRGALAGPVVVGAVAVMVEPDLTHIFPTGNRDSKKATVKQRQEVDALVRANFLYGIGSASVAEIESVGLSQALKLAATRALDQVISADPFFIHADAGLFHLYEGKYETKWSIKADENVMAVLLASHVAKVYRDNVMQYLAVKFPGYSWETNVGYGTKAHLEALRKHGPTVHHRQSFLKGL